MIKIKWKEPKDGEDQAESDEPNGRMIKSSRKWWTEPKDDKNQAESNEPNRKMVKIELKDKPKVIKWTEKRWKQTRKYYSKTEK